MGKRWRMRMCCVGLWSLLLLCVGMVGTVGVEAQVPPSPRAGQRKIFRLKNVRFAVRWIPAGSFWMGSPENEQGRDSDEGPQRRVTISKGFWMMETEVTQGLYRLLLGETAPHFQRCGDNCPVERVSWYHADAAGDNLSKAQGLPTCDVQDQRIFQCVGWRLPTEAEWEYAARAGTTRSRYGA